jgi:hypothetical protein
LLPDIKTVTLFAKPEREEFRTEFKNMSNAVLLRTIFNSFMRHTDMPPLTKVKLIELFNRIRLAKDEYDLKKKQQQESFFGTKAPEEKIPLPPSAKSTVKLTPSEMARLQELDEDLQEAVLSGDYSLREAIIEQKNRTIEV